MHNRKNALSAGHDLGAENWAAIASLTETCKLGGINPNAYLTDILWRDVVDGLRGARAGADDGYNRISKASVSKLRTSTSASTPF